MSGINIPLEESFPAKGNSYLKFSDENKNKVTIRLLQGPARLLVNTHYEENKGRPKEEQIKKDYYDVTPENKAIKGVSLHWFFLVYDYADNMVKMWDIGQRKTIESIIAISQEYGDLGERDIVISKQGKDASTIYTIMPKDKAPFTNEDALATVEAEPLDDRINAIRNYGEADEETPSTPAPTPKSSNPTSAEMSTEELDALFDKK